jgi:hypothetical protein
MNIGIPAWVMAAVNAFVEWANVPIVKAWRFEIVRVDVIMAVGLVGAVGYYWLAGGWLLALKGGVGYLLFLIAALLLRGRSEDESKKNKKTKA